LGCSGVGVFVFVVILSGTISLQFSIREEADELEHETFALPETSSVYPEMLNE
jgi:hypothetical protein